jgi:hypothetical protein
MTNPSLCPLALGCAISATICSWASWAAVGWGVVYEARQITLNRMVALEMIRSPALATEDEVRRFQNEAEAVATLDHPHIVPILETGEHDGQR